MDQDALAAQWEQQVENEGDKTDEPKQGASPEAAQEVKDARAANFTQLRAVNPAVGMNNLDFLLDIALQVSVHIGSTKMLIKDLLQLGQGSIIELNKLAGEPMDVLVNDRLIARGEVVVVNDKFGIRLTDVMNVTDRVEQLK